MGYIRKKESDGWLHGFFLMLKVACFFFKLNGLIGLNIFVAHSSCFLWIYLLPFSYLLLRLICSILWWRYNICHYTCCHIDLFWWVVYLVSGSCTRMCSFQVRNGITWISSFCFFRFICLISLFFVFSTVQPKVAAVGIDFGCKNSRVAITDFLVCRHLVSTCFVFRWQVAKVTIGA